MRAIRIRANRNAFRDWLRTEAERADIPGARAMQSMYADFRNMLPSICEQFDLDILALTFADLLFAIGILAHSS